MAASACLLAATGSHATEATSREPSPAPREYRAVEALGISVRLPSFDYSWAKSVDGGFFDGSKQQSYGLGAAFEGVAPLGDRFGLRAGLAGAWRPTKLESDLVSGSDLNRGRLGWNASLFWRDPMRGSLGLGYAGSTLFLDGLDRSVLSNTLSLTGLRFAGDFDFEMGLGVSFGKIDGVVTTNGTGSSSDSTSIGVPASLGVTWYPRAWLAARAGLSMSFTRQEWVGSAVGGVFRSTQGGPEVALQFLPPSGATKRRCVLETRVGYVRSASGFDAPSPTDHRNTVSVGAALRLVFPGVTSLKQLARHY